MRKANWPVLILVVVVLAGLALVASQFIWPTTPAIEIEATLVEE